MFSMTLHKTIQVFPHLSQSNYYKFYPYSSLNFDSIRGIWICSLMASEIRSKFPSNQHVLLVNGQGKGSEYHRIYQNIWYFIILIKVYIINFLRILSLYKANNHQKINFMLSHYLMFCDLYFKFINAIVLSSVSFLSFSSLSDQRK